MEQNEFNKRVNQDIQALINRGMIGPNTELDHLLLENNFMVCKHCGFQQQIKMGVTSWDELDDTFAKFQDFHKHCEAPTKPVLGEGVKDIAKQALTNAVNDGYQTGFDHGCDYLVNEAEYWVRTGKGTLAEFVQYMKDFKKG